MDNSFVCFGEVLWDMLPEGRQPGGAPMNVAVQLRNLGLESHLISRLGSDSEGEALRDFLASKGVPVEHLQEDGELPTGRVLVELLPDEAVAYDIVSPVAWDHIEAGEAERNLVIEKRALVFGSLAVRAASLDALRTLLPLASYRIFDLNFRPPHYRWPVIIELLEASNLAKLNEDEFTLLLAHLGASDLDMEAGTALIQERFDLDTLLLTMGSQGAAVWDARDASGFHQHPAFPIELADPVGSGDAFLAGFLSARADGLDAASGLELACAAGAFVAARQGAVPDLSLQSLESLIVGSR
jgi:fructokinase